MAIILVLTLLVSGSAYAVDYFLRTEKFWMLLLGLSVLVGSTIGIMYISGGPTNDIDDES